MKLNATWKKLEQTGFKFYCVSCQRERHLSVPAKSGSPVFLFHVSVTTAFFMVVASPWLQWKGAVLALPVYIFFEVLYRMKMRAALICPDCDFDPILYLVNREQAVKKVENQWRKRFEEHGHPYPERKKARIQNPLTENPETRKSSAWQLTK